jgi:hypothetical protein
MAYANATLKLRITAFGKDTQAFIAAIITGLLYVIALRQLERSVGEPLFALVFVAVPLAAVQRTWSIAEQMSANDPKQISSASSQ